MRSYYREDAKRGRPTSLEFLTGRLLSNSLINLGCEDACRDALDDAGLHLADLAEIEQDAALGNGGRPTGGVLLMPWRCCRCPDTGHGIRYEYGKRSGSASRTARKSKCLTTGCAKGQSVEFPRPEVSMFPVKFGGRVAQFTYESGAPHFHWVETKR